MSSLTSEYRHVPVMLTEVEQTLSLKPGDVVCDCTLGGAGHTVALAQHVAPDGLSLGIDQDDAALYGGSSARADKIVKKLSCLSVYTSELWVHKKHI